MRKLTILAAGAVGYVLGTRAGRERYEQLVRQAQRLRENPTVQQKVGEARHVATDAAKEAAGKVRHHGDDASRTSTTASATQVPGTATNGFGRGDEGV
jgi:hypothetical protein